MPYRTPLIPSLNLDTPGAGFEFPGRKPRADLSPPASDRAVLALRFGDAPAPPASVLHPRGDRRGDRAHSVAPTTPSCGPFLPVELGSPVGVLAIALKNFVVPAHAPAPVAGRCVVAPSVGCGLPLQKRLGVGIPGSLSER